MSVEETPAEDDPLSRPLPSVDIPLLRHQRRDARTKQLAMLAAGVGIVSSAVAVFTLVDFDFDFGFGFGGGDGGDDVLEPSTVGAPANGSAPRDLDGSLDGASQNAAATTAPTAPPEPVTAASHEPTVLGAVTRTEAAFGNGRGFRAALVAAGASAEEYEELEDALEEVMDFRRCRATDRLIFERDTDRNILLFEYRGNSIEYYQVTRNRRGELRGEKVEIPIETRRISRGGSVQTSLGAAFEGAGLGRALVGRFMEAFEGKVNFNTHPRAGDTFRIIAEEERISGEFHGWGRVHAVEYMGQRTGELRAFWFSTGNDDDGEFYEEDGRAMRGGWLRTPLQYDRISSRFDLQRMHPILRRVHPHNGVDYAAGTGAPVWATADGTVTFAGERGANGNLVALRHANGYESYYAHLSRFARGLSRGDEVEQRQLIGYVGSTGRSTGPHLHFGLKRNGRFLDPLEEINGPGRMMPRGHLPRFRTQARRLGREIARIETGTSAPASAPATPGGASDESTEEPMD
ncbi:MAG: M23 family metallopeptidase [Deltaproteobacteria bacterium]|nr:M23 family metallopeptidase [Deltaproteobacteria bacterium]